MLPTNSPDVDVLEKELHVAIEPQSKTANNRLTNGGEGTQCFIGLIYSFSRLEWKQH